MACHPDTIWLCTNHSFLFPELWGSQDNAFVLVVYLAVKANGELARWLDTLYVFCPEDGWCCLFWAGSVANQLFHQVMFDRCLHTLTKSWPQEPDMRKRKKVHTQSSQTNARRNRKKGKPRRNGNVRCLYSVFRYKSLLISKSLASYFTSRSMWYSFSLLF